MTRFEPGDLAHAPFPHIERAVLVRRPVLVLASVDTGRIGTLLWVAMITNADRPNWLGDVVIPDAPARGLIIPSKVRTAKLSTVAATDAARIGRLDDASWVDIRRIVHQTLGTA